ncbi:hypothetical protein MMPV_007491 [Pyropia vietnamensis]
MVGRRQGQCDAHDAVEAPADVVRLSVEGVDAAVDPRQSTLPSPPPPVPSGAISTAAAAVDADADADAVQDATVDADADSDADADEESNADADADADATSMRVPRVDAVCLGGDDDGGKEYRPEDGSGHRHAEASRRDDGSSGSDGSGSRCAGCGDVHAEVGRGGSTGMDRGSSRGDAVTDAERPLHDDGASGGEGNVRREPIVGASGSGRGDADNATAYSKDIDGDEPSSSESTDSDDDSVETTVCVFRIFDDANDMWLLLNMVAVLVDKPAKDGMSMPASAVSGHRVDEPLLSVWRDAEAVAAAAVSFHLDATVDDDVFTKRGRDEAVKALYETPYALARVPDPPAGVPAADDDAAVFFSPPWSGLVVANPPVEPVRYLRALIVKRKLPPSMAIMALLLAHRGRLALPGLAPCNRSLYRLLLGAVELVGSDAESVRAAERRVSAAAAAAARDPSGGGEEKVEDPDRNTDEILAAPGLPNEDEGAAVAAALWRTLGPAAVVSREDAAAYAWGLMQRYEKLVGCRSGVLVLSDRGGGGYTPAGWQPRRPRVVAVPPAELAKAAEAAAKLVADEGTPGLSRDGRGGPRQFPNTVDPSRPLRWIPHGALARVLQTVMEGAEGVVAPPDEPAPANSTIAPTAAALAAASDAMDAGVSPIDATPNAGRVPSAAAAAAAARVAAHPCPVRIRSAAAVTPPPQSSDNAIFFRLFLPCPPAEPRLMPIMAFTWFLGSRGKVPPMLILAGLVLAARAQDVDRALLLTDWTAHRLMMAGVGLAAMGTRWSAWTPQLYVGSAETADAVEVATLVSRLCGLLGGQQGAVVTVAEAAAMEWTLVYWFRRSGVRPGEGNVPAAEAANLQPLLTDLADDGFDVAQLLPVRRSRRPPVRQGPSRRQRASAAMAAAVTEAAATEATAADASTAEEVAVAVSATEATVVDAAAATGATATDVAVIDATATDATATEAGAFQAAAGDADASHAATTQATAFEGATADMAAADAEANEAEVTAVNAAEAVDEAEGAAAAATASETVVHEAVADEATVSEAAAPEASAREASAPDVALETAMPQAVAADAAGAAAPNVVAPESTTDLQGRDAGTTTASTSPDATASTNDGGAAIELSTTADGGVSRGGAGMATVAPPLSAGGECAGYGGGGASSDGAGVEGATTDATAVPALQSNCPVLSGGGDDMDAAEGATTDEGGAGALDLTAVRSVDTPPDAQSRLRIDPSAGSAGVGTADEAASAEPIVIPDRDVEGTLVNTTGPPHTAGSAPRDASAAAAEATTVTPAAVDVRGGARPPAGGGASATPSASVSTGVVSGAETVGAGASAPATFTGGPPTERVTPRGGTSSPAAAAAPAAAPRRGRGSGGRRGWGTSGPGRAATASGRPPQYSPPPSVAAAADSRRGRRGGGGGGAPPPPPDSTLRRWSRRATGWVGRGASRVGGGSLTATHGERRALPPSGMVSRSSTVRCRRPRKPTRGRGATTAHPRTHSVVRRSADGAAPRKSRAEARDCCHISHAAAGSVATPSDRKPSRRP